MINLSSLCCCIGYLFEFFFQGDYAMLDLVSGILYYGIEWIIVAHFLQNKIILMFTYLYILIHFQLKY